MTDTEKLDLVLEKLAFLSEKFEQFEERLENIEQKMDNLEQKMDSLEKRVALLEKEVSDLKSRLTQVESDLRDVQQKVSILKLIVENELRVNIKRIAEGHLDLSQNLHEAMKPSSELETLSIRVGVLESNVKELQKKIS